MIRVVTRNNKFGLSIQLTVVDESRPRVQLIKL